jgi:hypothetical protein
MPKLGALRHMHLDFEDLHAIVFPTLVKIRVKLTAC